MSPLSGTNGYNWYVSFKYIDYNKQKNGKYYRGTYHGCYIKMWGGTWHILTCKDILEHVLLREELKEVIVNIRNIRANMNIHPSRKTKLIFVIQKDQYEDLIEKTRLFMERLGFANEIIIQRDKDGIAANAISIVTENIEVFIPFDELVDIEQEKMRLQAEKTKLTAEVERIEKMFENAGFMSKAPAHKIEEEQQKLEKYKQMLSSVEDRLMSIL